VSHLSLRVQVKYDEITNKIILFGSLQELNDGAIASNTQDETKEKIRFEGVSLDYSSAIPKNFDFFEYLHTASQYFENLFKSDLSDEQRATLQNLALAIGNYTKTTSIFHQLLPLLERKEYSFEQEFKTSEVIDKIKDLFKFQKPLSKTVVNFNLLPDTTEILSGNKQDIQNAVFNLILQAIGGCAPASSIDVQIQEEENQDFRLKFIISFPGNVSDISKIECLSKDPGIFDIDNLQNLFQQYPVDIFTNAYLISRIKANLKITEGKVNKIEVSFPAHKIEKKIKNGKIELPVRILLAEDHVMNRIVLKKTLISWSDKIKVDIVNSGTEVLKTINSNYYDVIIMNVNLPEKGSIETTELIRKKSLTPILGISSYPSTQEKQICLEAGMNQYLEKPFSNQNLFSQIIDLLEKA
jgi:CheY-like chemotaxis protein